MQHRFAPSPPPRHNQPSRMNEQASPLAAKVQDSEEARPPAAGPGGAPPLCWAVLSYRTGDNSQILALAKGLGWPFQVKRFRYRAIGRIVDFLRLTSLLGIDRAQSSSLEPPWPDLLISATMGNETICRWIQRQAGKPVRCIYIGRTWARPGRFDLIVTTPEFRMRQLPNVLQNQLGLAASDESRLQEAAAQLAPSLARLPRPYIAVLVGGYGGPNMIDAAAARRLGRIASKMARECGGSLLVTTSRRTPLKVTAALEAAIDVPAHVYRWQPDDPANPYVGYLGLADRFIVTCDSSVMLAEACATCRPVFMFDTGPGVPGERQPWRPRLPDRCDLERLKAIVYRIMLRLPPRRMTRDIRLVHDHLVRSGRAVWLGAPFPAQRPPPLDDVERAVESVRALFQSGMIPRTAARPGIAGVGADEKARAMVAAAAPTNRRSE